MKATRANQRVAREIAEFTARPKGVDWRKVREENQRRQDRVLGKAARGLGAREDLTWLAHDVFSTPFAEYRG